MNSLRRLLDTSNWTGYPKEIALAGLLGISSRTSFGTNVFERDWDLLVVLDTCRVDALREVSDEYDFLDGVESMWSVGSSTREWVASTYTNEYLDEIEETAIASANATVQYALERGNTALESEFVDRFTAWDMVDPDDPLLLDAVWEYTPRDPFGGLVLPDVVTDRAIAIGRELDPDRLVAHYMPPHAPYRANALRSNRDMKPHEREPWDALRAGTERKVVWESYLDELRWALDHVEVLLENVDAETVAITADHGDSFGEYGIYSHPSGIPHPHTRRVPWTTCSASDSGEYEPSIEAPADKGIGGDVEDQLEKLGYL